MDGAGDRVRGLGSPWQGALAGGGDPASSPLYVFGPFLTLLAGAGVASATFGTSIWLAVLTIGVVSVMYRLVMRWVVDGSGGTGLSEEVFGSWAARLNAAITVVEFTLTFAVSIAALVTFVADRVPELRESFAGVEGRTLLALAVTGLTAMLVNRGPRAVGAVLGPATGAVLVLLWVMVVATLVKQGFRPAAPHPEAFAGRDLGYTLGGYARILAVMTGVEVFANLVAAYAGPPEVRSRMAFQSLTIIMVTTAVAMVIVGPAILALADPGDPDVSVFTQAMDALLPEPLALAGSAAGVAVLLSAAAASALGLQNLGGGLSIRRYVPAALGRRNRFGVAALPVWLEAGAVALAFLLLGTDESTFLGPYAAGVFVLLSMTGWAAAIRIWRRRRDGGRLDGFGFASSVVAGVLTTVATVIIVVERFEDGVWVYLVLLPVLFATFGAVRRGRGAPGDALERLGRLQANAASTASWSHDLVDPDRRLGPEATAAALELDAVDGVDNVHLHVPDEVERGPRHHVVVPLDGSEEAERAMPLAVGLAERVPGRLVLVHAHEGTALDPEVDRYLERVVAVLVDSDATVEVEVAVDHGPPALVILAAAVAVEHSLVVMSTHGHTGLRRVLMGSVTAEVLARGTVPVLTVRPPVPPAGSARSGSRRRAAR